MLPLACCGPAAVSCMGFVLDGGVLHAVRLHRIIVIIAGGEMRAHRDEETATRCKHSESPVFIPASPLQCTVAMHRCNERPLRRMAAGYTAPKPDSSVSVMSTNAGEKPTSIRSSWRYLRAMHTACQSADTSHPHDKWQYGKHASPGP